MGLKYTVTEEGRVVSNIGALTSSSKGDLTTGSQELLGNSETYIANGDLVAGQPVEFDYTGGNVTVKTITGISSGTFVAGIVCEDVTNGNLATIVTSGFVTGRRTTVFNPSSETYDMPSSGSAPTTNIRPLTNNTTFRDAGGSGNYPSSQNHWVVFDAGSGYTQIMTPNDFEFEANDFSIYDKLAIQVSTDDITYTNFEWDWGQRLASDATPFSSTSYFGSQFDSATSYPGYCFPGTPTRAQTLNGGTAVIGVDIAIPYRYVKYWFRSDGSSVADGFNLTLKPNTPYTTAAQSVPTNSLIYLDNSDYTLLSTDSTSNVFIGYCANEDAQNDAIFIRLGL